MQLVEFSNRITCSCHDNFGPHGIIYLTAANLFHLSFAFLFISFLIPQLQSETNDRCDSCRV